MFPQKKRTTPGLLLPHGKWGIDALMADFPQAKALATDAAQPNAVPLDMGTSHRV
jgi:hypothetical protein